MDKKKLFEDGEIFPEELDITDEDIEFDLIIQDDEDDNEDEIDDVLIEIDEDGDDEDEFGGGFLSKHKAEGKHSLKHDSIFKGKKEDDFTEEESMVTYVRETIEVDKSSHYHQESIENETYIRQKLLKERIYEVLDKDTDLNFSANRRKPSKIDFNEYFALIKKKLKDESFTNVEIFIELSVYFSDNLLNMFKLLDNKWRDEIIEELKSHIGKNENSKEIKNRNIYEGTELEFTYINEEGKEYTYTGVVKETNYEDSRYIIDSFENIYDIHLSDVTKILNNTKFKYNLNMLQNIDFL